MASRSARDSISKSKMVSRNAHYGIGKNLRDESWDGIGKDIMRRLDVVDLHKELQTLSFRGRRMTKQGWTMLENVLPKLTTCFVLDLRACGITDVTPLVRMLPKLIRVCKCFDLGGNHLSAVSVKNLSNAMSKSFVGVRPTWLAIGEDACSDAVLSDPFQCNPHCKRGCVHARFSVVHVVRTLFDFRQQQYQQRESVIENIDTNINDTMQWPSLCSSGQESTATPPADESDESIEAPVQESGTSDIDAAFESFIEAQHAAFQMQILEIWSTLVDGVIVAPLALAARVTRKKATTSSDILHNSFAQAFTSIILNENMYIVAVQDGHLTLINLSVSIHKGKIIDYRLYDASNAVPLKNFRYIVEAEPHDGTGEYELRTSGGEILNVRLEATDYILSG